MADKNTYEIEYNIYMDREEFVGTLEEVKKDADSCINYTQQDITIYLNDNPVVKRKWCGVSPSEEDKETNIIEIGNGFYTDWIEVEE